MIVTMWEFGMHCIHQRVEDRGKRVEVAYLLAARLVGEPAADQSVWGIPDLEDILVSSLVEPSIVVVVVVALKQNKKMVNTSKVCLDRIIEIV